jgi:UDP-N-acetylglucosamine 2-epimerase (non-hydrolysing)
LILPNTLSSASRKLLTEFSESDGFEMLKVINVVGARPNFMKVAPIVEEMKRREREFAPLVVHTGQHYDAGMSEAFFRDLELPEPDVYLGVGSGTHAGGPC